MQKPPARKRHFRAEGGPGRIFSGILGSSESDRIFFYRPGFNLFVERKHQQQLSVYRSVRAPVRLTRRTEPYRRFFTLGCRDLRYFFCASAGRTVCHPQLEVGIIAVCLSVSFDGWQDSGRWSELAVDRRHQAVIFFGAALIAVATGWFFYKVYVAYTSAGGTDFAMPIYDAAMYPPMMLALGLYLTLTALEMTYSIWIYVGIWVVATLLAVGLLWLTEQLGDKPL
jgi:hypothetical protein